MKGCSTRICVIVLFILTTCVFAQAADLIHVSTSISETGGVISPTFKDVKSGSAASFSLKPFYGYSTSVSGCNGERNGLKYKTGTITSACTVEAAFTALPMSLAITSKPITTPINFNGKSGVINFGVKGVTSNQELLGSVSANSSWISIDLLTYDGKGKGSLKYTVAANQSSHSRDGNITIAGHDFSIIQAGKPCKVTINPVSSTPLSGWGGSTNVTVSTDPIDGEWSIVGTKWSPISTANWLHGFTNEMHTGNTSLVLEAEKNTTEAPRSVKLTLQSKDGKSRKNVTIKQSQTSPNDPPILKRIAIAEGLGSSATTANRTSLKVDGAATGITEKYYAGFGESVSLYIEIFNPSGFSISRFMINGTAFTSGSFTTDPIQPGQTTTVIRTVPISLGNTAKTETYSIGDIKYIAEIGQAGSEKDVVINADSVTFAEVVIGFSGSGTVDDPYLIENVGQLKAVARCTNGNIGGVDGYKGKHLKLTADIDLTGENWIPIGIYDYDFKYDKCFKGSFDGGAKTISNLAVDSSSIRNVGLFGYVYGGDIKNIQLTNAQITNSVFNGFTGGIAGAVQNGAIQNCSNSDGVVIIKNSSSGGGGIVGYLYASTVSGAANGATVSSESANIIDHIWAGGITGLTVEQSVIQNCYNSGAISATGSEYTEAAGIVARVYSGNVSNCYNVGKITVSNTGFSYCTSGAGIVGSTGGPITNSIWLEGSAATMTCADTGTIATGKSSSEMMLQSTYTNIGWDFVGTWKINGGEYPKLMWQN